MRVLAHVTESRMRAPLDDPDMAGFVHAFGVVTRLARDSPGFCWQLESSDRGHPVVEERDPLRVLNVSTWVDYPSLHRFVYRSAHGQALLRRERWFARVEQPSTALWWVEADDEPSADDALARLAHLRRTGPTCRAFTMMRRFDAAGRRERGRLSSR